MTTSNRFFILVLTCSLFAVFNSHSLADTSYWDRNPGGYEDPDIPIDVDDDPVYLISVGPPPGDDSDGDDEATDNGGGDDGEPDDGDDGGGDDGEPDNGDDGVTGDGDDSTTWFLDSDGDGFGNPGISMEDSGQPDGYVINNSDCNDADADIYPGAIDIPGDGVDQDCSFSVADTPFSGTLASDEDGGLAPAAIEFYTLIVSGSPPYTYDWDFGDGNAKSDGNKIESHTYDSTGTYTAVVTVTDAEGDAIQLPKNILVTDANDVDDFEDNLQTDADLMDQADDGNDIADLLQDAEDNIQKILESIVNADDAYKDQVEDSVRSKVEDLVDSTEYILETLIQGSQVTGADLADISLGLSGVVSNMVKNGLTVSHDTLEDLESISGIIYSEILDQVLAGENLTQAEIDELKTDKAKARTFFQGKVYLMEDVVDATGIQVDTTSEFDPEKVGMVASDHGLTEQQAGLLFNAVEPTLDTGQKISSAPPSKTIADIAWEIFNTYYGKTVSNVTVEDITRNILLAFSDGAYISFVVNTISIVEDYMPKGLFDLPNGGKLGVTDSYAVEFAPYPVFPLDLSSEVIKLDYIPLLNRDGGLNVQSDQLESLSMKMGWDYFTDSGFNSLTTSFSVTGGSDPAGEAYSLLVTYDTGKSQLMPPTIMAVDALTEWLDAAIPGGYTINPDTGVLQVLNAKFKPDYTFESMTGIDYPAILAGGGFQYGALAFGLGDFNADGLFDLKFYSNAPMGAQILYTVP